jgi:hypothetical protein
MDDKEKTGQTTAPADTECTKEPQTRAPAPPPERETLPPPPKDVRFIPDDEVKAVPPPEPAAPKTKKAKKGITFNGICIYCGERFTLAENEMSQRSFGFCNPACRMKFDMDLSEEID